MTNKTAPLRLALTIIAVNFCANAAQAQWNPPGSTSPSYANLYDQQLSASGRVMLPQTYIWDRYYYNNPNVSPYLNLARIQPYGSNDYLTYVKPQEDARRAAAASSSIGGPQMSGNRPPANTGSMGLHPFGGASSYSASQIEPYSPAAPSRGSSFYYNHWYGGWKGRN